MLATAVITALQSERYTDTQSYIPSESFRLTIPMISFHYLHGLFASKDGQMKHTSFTPIID